MIINNGFSRDTAFLTNIGVKTFNDFKAGDKVVLINADGIWFRSKVVNTGKIHDMLSITIMHDLTGKEKTITCTYCHKFPVRRITEKPQILQARYLRAGYKLIPNINNKNIDDLLSFWTISKIEKAESQLGWCVQESLTDHFTLEDNILARV